MVGLFRRSLDELEEYLLVKHSKQNDVEGRLVIWMTVALLVVVVLDLVFSRRGGIWADQSGEGMSRY